MRCVRLINRIPLMPYSTSVIRNIAGHFLGSPGHHAIEEQQSPIRQLIRRMMITAAAQIPCLGMKRAMASSLVHCLRTGSLTCLVGVSTMVPRPAIRSRMVRRA